MDVRPIEEVDPDVANFFLDIVQKKYNYGIKSIRSEGDGFVYTPAPVKSKSVGRNDPCYCGSGKKFKKCCM